VIDVAGEGAAVASDRILVAREVIVREKPERTDKIDKPKKASPQRAQRVPKRPRWHDSTEEAEAEAPPKRRDRKAAVKSAWWSHGSGNMTEVETELLDAVAILRSLQNSPPCPQVSFACRVGLFCLYRGLFCLYRGPFAPYDTCFTPVSPAPAGTRSSECLLLRGRRSRGYV
jgi:hypothetical protein